MYIGIFSLRFYLTETSYPRGLTLPQNLFPMGLFQKAVQRQHFHHTYNAMWYDSPLRRAVSSSSQGGR